MRRLVTGVDAAGRSCLVEDGEVAYTDPGLPGLRMLDAYTAGADVALSPAPGDAVETGHASSARARWHLLEWDPGTSFPLHHTNTFAFDLVLEGGGELELEDGFHPVAAGDLIVMTGVQHGWRAGPDGCRLSVVTLPLPRER